MSHAAVRIPAFLPLLLGVVVAIGGFPAAPAHAIALYDARAEAKITLLGFEDALGNPIAAPAGLSIIADASVFDSETDPFGTGNANVDGSAFGTTADMLIGDSVHLTSRSFGDAQLPDGFAFSFHDPEGFVEIDNFSGQTVRTVFQLFYDWDLAISVDDPDTESAYAELYIDILGGVCGCDDPDVDVLVEEFLDSFDLRAAGSPAASDTDSFEFSILLLPDEFAFIDIFIGTLGEADAFGEISVPAPPALAVLFPALFVIGAVRRRRGASL